MPDFIPQSDSDFDDFVRAFQAFCVAHGAGLGMTAGAVTTLDTTVNGAWEDALGDLATKRDAALAATATKDSVRATLIGLVRSAAAIIQASPSITEALLAEAHLPIRDTTRTRVPVPTTRPLAVADTSQRLQHTLSWRDETTPNSKAKPPGVQGAEIWFSIGPTPPSDPSQCRFAALDSATPYLLHHDAADGGKIAHYLLRWVNTRGEPGPWSETVSATIGA